MALMQCSNCGGKVSDTVANCIHCGAPIKKTEQVDINDNIRQKESVTETEKPKANEPEINNPEKKKPVNKKPEVKLSPYSKLSDEKKIALENEFLKTDKRARRYRRKGVEKGKYLSITFWILVFARLLLAAQSYVVENYFGGEIFNQQYIEYSYYCLGALAVIWIASFIMGLYCAISYRGVIKKHTYNKKFQKWLRDKKKIEYVPNLIDERDRQIFEQIDLNTMKL